MKKVLAVAVMAIVILFSINAQAADVDNAERDYLLVWHFYLHGEYVLAETDFIKANSKKMNEKVSVSRQKFKKEYIEIEYLIMLHQVVPL